MAGTVNEAHIRRRLERSLTVAGHARSDDGRLDPKTMRKYTLAWQQFEAWCVRSGLTAMPCTSETLAQYAAHMLTEGYAPATVEGRIAAIKAMHRLRGADSVPDGVAARYVLRGGEPSPTASGPVNHPLGRRGVMRRVAAACDLTRPQGLRDRCLVLLAYDLLVSEAALVALDLEDVVLLASPALDLDDPHDLEDAAGESAGLEVRVDGRTLPVRHNHLPNGSGEACPVCGTWAWVCTLAEAGALSGPLLRSVDKADNIGGLGPKAGTAGEGGRLNVRGLHRVWARVATAAGLPHTTPRQLRLGGAAAAVIDGMPIPEVIARAGWSPNSGAVLRRLLDATAAAQQGAAA